MKQVLVISRNPGFAPALEAAVGVGDFQWLARATAAEAGVETAAGCDACILAVAELNAETVRELETLANHFHGRVLVHCRNVNAAWEEAAYLAGAGQILKGSLRGSLLLRWLEQMSQAPELPRAAPGAVPAAEPAVPAAALISAQDLVELFNHPSDPRPLVMEFLRVIRRLPGLNRIGIFSTSKPGAAARCLGQLGQPAFHPDLSADSALAREIVTTGRVQSLNSPDPKIRAELQRLGAEAAFPVAGPDSISAIALIGEGITGALDESHFDFLLSLFEALGHSLEKAAAQLSAATDLRWQGQVIDRVVGGSFIVNQERKIVHIDAGARACLSLPDNPRFHDLPNVIGTHVFRALTPGDTTKNQETKNVLLCQPSGNGRHYELTFEPLEDEKGRSVLALVRDVTDVGSSEQAAVADSNRQLIRNMAEHLAHEIGNSLVPLSTSQQLLAEGVTDTAGLESVMAESIRRIARMTAQMQYLSREGLQRIDTVPVRSLIEEAFGDASSHVSKLKPRLEFDKPSKELKVSGEKAGLRHALAEVILNAMQAGTKTPRVVVRVGHGELDGKSCLDVDISDFGEGFPAETLEQAVQPFYSGRAVGLGLGLTAAKHILDLHEGQLQVIPPGEGEAGCVRLRIQVESLD